MDDKNKLAEEYKAKGNEAFKANNYAQAKELYTKAIGISPSSHPLPARTLSQRSHLLWQPISLQCCHGMVDLLIVLTKWLIVTRSAFETVSRPCR